MKAPGSALLAVLLSLAPVLARGAELPPPADLSQPITADQAVRLALERNYSIRQAEDRVGIAKASRLQAYGQLLPSATGSFGYQHDRTSGTLFDVLGPGQDIKFPEQRFDTRQYSLSLDHTVLSLPNLLRIAAEKRSTGAAEADVRDAEHQAAFGVRQQYFTLIESLKLLDVSRDDLRLATEEQKRTESLFQVGSVARTDVLKARVRVAEAQSALTRAENNADLDRARLANALALPQGAPIQVIENLDPRAELPDSTAAFAQAEQNRPDLRAARLRLGAASAGKKAAVAGKLPFLTQSYNYTIRNRPGDYDIDPSQEVTNLKHLNLQTRGWSYQLGVGWNFLDKLVTEGNIVRGRAEELSARHEAESITLQVGLDVREALLALRAARAQITSAREGLASAEEDLKLSQERYSVGLGTILELIDAQVALTRARSAEVQAMAALKIAEAQLDRATGVETW